MRKNVNGNRPMPIGVGTAHKQVFGGCRFRKPIWVPVDAGIGEMTNRDRTRAIEFASNGCVFRIAGRSSFGIFVGFRISASVAQLAEQRFCKPQVVGSSPSAGS